MTEPVSVPAEGGVISLPIRSFSLLDVCLFLDLMQEDPTTTLGQLCLHVTGISGYDPATSRIDGDFNTYLVWHHLMQLHAAMPLWEQVVAQYPELLFYTPATAQDIHGPEDLTLLRPAVEQAFRNKIVTGDWPVTVTPLSLPVRAELATRLADHAYRRTCLREVLQGLFAVIVGEPSRQ